MPRILTFALVAPLASFGDVAVGERRGGADRPARSAVLGLVGACLGVERHDAAAQAALEVGYDVAVLCHAPGGMLADWHTVQQGRPKRGQRFATRAAELASGALDTILTRRDYRQGAWHLGAIWPRDGAPRWTLDAIADAMRRPVFVPYLGRKSCPLGLPLAPDIVEGDNIPAALLARHAGGPEQHERLATLRRRWPMQGGRLSIALPPDAVPEGAAASRREIRRDAIRSRSPWQFDLREEAILEYPTA
jgi:CRISPR system Cascade subunit CasD